MRVWLRPKENGIRKMRFFFGNDLPKNRRIQKIGIWQRPKENRIRKMRFLATTWRKTEFGRWESGTGLKRTKFGRWDFWQRPGQEQNSEDESLATTWRRTNFGTGCEQNGGISDEMLKLRPIRGLSKNLKHVTSVIFICFICDGVIVVDCLCCGVKNKMRTQ